MGATSYTNRAPPTRILPQLGWRNLIAPFIVATESPATAMKHDRVESDDGERSSLAESNLLTTIAGESEFATPPGSPTPKLFASPSLGRHIELQSSTSPLVPATPITPTPGRRFNKIFTDVPDSPFRELNGDERAILGGLKREDSSQLWLGGSITDLDLTSPVRRVERSKCSVVREWDAEDYSSNLEEFTTNLFGEISDDAHLLSLFEIGGSESAMVSLSTIAEGDEPDPEVGSSGVREPSPVPPPAQLPAELEQEIQPTTGGWSWWWNFCVIM